MDTILRLRTQLAQAERRIAQLQALLVKTHDLSKLEPLNPAPIGTLTPRPGESVIVHVDSLRLKSNRIRNVREPSIRILHGDAILHAHHVRIGPVELAERYHQPVSDRAPAVCVLETAHPIEVVR